MLVAEHDAEPEGDDRDEVADHRTAGRADAPEQRPRGDERQPRPQRSEDDHGSHRLPRQRGVGHADQGVRRGEHEAGDLRPPDDRQRAVALLQRHDEVAGEAVGDDGDEDERGTQGGARAALHRGQADREDAEESDDQAGDLVASRRPAQEHRGDQRGHQRYRPVEHAGDRRRDPLLGDREQHHRYGQPHEAEDRRSAAGRPGRSSSAEPWARASGRGNRRPGGRRRRRRVRASPGPRR